MTDAFVSEWKHISKSMFQHLAKSLPRRVETVRAEGIYADYTIFWFQEEPLHPLNLSTDQKVLYTMS